MKDRSESEADIDSAGNEDVDVPELEMQFTQSRRATKNVETTLEAQCARLIALAQSYYENIDRKSVV